MKSLIIACSIQIFIILLFVTKFFYFKDVTKPINNNNQYTNQSFLISIQALSKPSVVVESSVEEHQLALITNKKLLAQFRATTLAWQPNPTQSQLLPQTQLLPQRVEINQNRLKPNQLNIINH